MLIKINHAEVVVPGQPTFRGGHTYVVDPSVGRMLVDRGQAEEVPTGDAPAPKPKKRT